MRANIPEVWDRLFEMQGDEDSIVRSLVLHVLGDGSPTGREHEGQTAPTSATRSPKGSAVRQRSLSDSEP